MNNFTMFDMTEPPNYKTDYVLSFALKGDVRYNIVRTRRKMCEELKTQYYQFIKENGRETVPFEFNTEGDEGTISFFPIDCVAVHIMSRKDGGYS